MHVATAKEGGQCSKFGKLGYGSENWGITESSEAILGRNANNQIALRAQGLARPKSRIRCLRNPRQLPPDLMTLKIFEHSSFRIFDNIEIDRVGLNFVVPKTL